MGRPRLPQGHSADSWGLPCHFRACPGLWEVARQAPSCHPKDSSSQCPHGLAAAPTTQPLLHPLGHWGHAVGCGGGSPNVHPPQHQSGVSDGHSSVKRGPGQSQVTTFQHPHTGHSSHTGLSLGPRIAMPLLRTCSPPVLLGRPPSSSGSQLRCHFFQETTLPSETALGLPHLSPIPGSPHAPITALATTSLGVGCAIADPLHRGQNQGSERSPS